MRAVNWVAKVDFGRSLRLFALDLIVIACKKRGSEETIDKKELFVVVVNKKKAKKWKNQWINTQRKRMNYENEMITRD